MKTTQKHRNRFVVALFCTTILIQFPQSDAVFSVQISFVANATKNICLNNVQGGFSFSSYFKL